uniref:hypothetical protein n=1 Tax=Paracoccus rhizosphaerae TaxID=1133347 RepID=UPI002240D9A3
PRQLRTPFKEVGAKTTETQNLHNAALIKLTQLRPPSPNAYADFRRERGNLIFKRFMQQRLVMGFLLIFAP